MRFNKVSGQIHPLIAGAAASIMLVSLVGTAAIVGILPTSHSSNLPATAAAPVATTPAPLAAPSVAAAVPVHNEKEGVYVQHHGSHSSYRPRTVRHRDIAVAQAPTYTPPAPAPSQSSRPAPVAQNSPVGIGVGAVVGGILGSQVGGGNGRTLATIAGAIGGGYIGNKIAQQQNN